MSIPDHREQFLRPSDRKVHVAAPTYAKMPREERRMLTPEPGTIVGEKYRILRALGEGGMGTVYEAENTLTAKRAAIKWLHPRLVNVEDASKRLLHEARATARIRHRNVVDVYDVLVEGTSVFLVMELLLGEQLAVLLAREELWLHELIRLLLPAMAGVAAAHAVGVIHRDIKPDNILLAREEGTKEPVPKVIDFGISRVFEADGARLTHSGMTMGTPKYVSYEQLRGVRDIDARTDIYAFGVILYEATLGFAPYEATTLGEQAISFVTTEPALPVSIRAELPGPLSELLMATIHKDREQRISTMEELIARLEPYADASHYAEPMRTRRPRVSIPPLGDGFCGRTTAPLQHTSRPDRKAQRGAQASRSLPAPAAGSRARRPKALACAAAAVTVAGWLLWPFSEPAATRAPAALSSRRVDLPQRAAQAVQPTDPALPPALPLDGPTALEADASLVGATPAQTAHVAAPTASRAMRARRQAAPESRQAEPAEPSPKPESDPSVADAAWPSPRLEVGHRAGSLRRDQF